MAEQFILLPRRGVRAAPEDLEALDKLALARSTESPAPSELPYQVTWGGEEYERAAPVQVVDTVDPAGPRLVEMDAEVALELRAARGLRLAPLRKYRPLLVQSALPLGPPPSGGAPATTIEVVTADGGAPIEGVEVTAVVDGTLNLGDTGRTDPTGSVSLSLGPAPVHLDELRVERPLHGFWGAWFADIVITSPHQVVLEAIDLQFVAFKDALRHFYGSAPGADGGGVRVAIVDSGIDLQHPDLSVHDGRNTVRGEPRRDYDDSGLGHGTHVAGIVAARGAAPTGVRGLAPDVELWSYRVYGQGAATANTYSITKALWHAVEDECHVVNLSLGGLQPDQALKDAVDDAWDQGTIIIAAAGNDGRKPVTVPAVYAYAASALGRTGTFPTNARELQDVAQPSGADPDDFLAGFTNVGQDIDFIAPGVGIVSTVPGGHAPERGTSMAAAMVTGMAARLMSAQPSLLQMPADANRSKAFLNVLTNQAASKGFAYADEGFGML